MGNRGVIQRENSPIGIYLHWNGGRDSVDAFLKYCAMREFRDDDYGTARLCQVICNFIGGDLSVGIDLVKNLDCNNHDNGLYIIKNWCIVGRRHFNGDEQLNHDLLCMLEAIDLKQPEGDRLGLDVIKSKINV